MGPVRHIGPPQSHEEVVKHHELPRVLDAHGVARGQPLHDLIRRASEKRQTSQGDRLRRRTSVHFDRPDQMARSRWFEHYYQTPTKHNTVRIPALDHSCAIDLQQAPNRLVNRGTQSNWTDRARWNDMHIDHQSAFSLACCQLTSTQLVSPLELLIRLGLERMILGGHDLALLTGLGGQNQREHDVAVPMSRLDALGLLLPGLGVGQGRPFPAWMYVVRALFSVAEGLMSASRPDLCRR